MLLHRGVDRLLGLLRHLLLTCLERLLQGRGKLVHVDSWRQL
jgi:hypothetical protein